MNDPLQVIQKGFWMTFFRQDRLLLFNHSMIKFVPCLIQLDGDRINRIIRQSGQVTDIEP